MINSLQRLIFGVVILFVCKKLYGRTIKDILGTQGSKKALIVGLGMVLVCIYFAVGNVVNTVGAGDALCSSFVHYYAKGLKADEALMRAQIFASYKIGFDGASVGFATEEKVEELWENFY